MASEADQLAAEIARLQAKQRAIHEKEERRLVKEKEIQTKVLVGASPVKRARASIVFDNATHHRTQSRFATLPNNLTIHEFTQPLPRPSSLATSFAQTNRGTTSPEPSTTTTSSSYGKDVPSQGKAVTNSLDAKRAVEKAKRDKDTLKVIENLKICPIVFGKDVNGSQDWLTVEPNSGFNLKERVLSHEQLQANLSDRYFITPSVLYSIMQPSRDGQAYNVPLDAEWVTIAVVCKKFHRLSSGGTYERSEWDSDDEEKEEKTLSRGTDNDVVVVVGDKIQEKKRKKIATGRVGKHFAILELAMLPSKASKTAATGGDAVVNLLLFQADKEYKVPNGQTRYKGGSGGAYERWNRLDVGSVIGVLSPKVIKPYSKDPKAHPLTNPVGLMPSSDKDIWYIGRSRDMGTCQANTKAGVRCGNAVDLRTTQFCEYHVVSAVKKKKGGRAEFSSNTSGFEIGASSQSYRDHKSDTPAVKGLLSKFGAGSVWAGNDAGGQTYVVEGRAFSAGRKVGEEFVGEQIGREKDRRIKRRREAEATEKDLQNLLQRDGGSSTIGGKYLEAAERLQRANKDVKGSAAGQFTSTQATPVTGSDKPRPFHADAVKRLGFDPTVKTNGKSAESREAGRHRLEAIALLNAGGRAPPKLGPMPGTWNKSNAKVPARHLAALNAALPTPTLAKTELFVNLDSDDDDDDCGE